MNSRPLVLSVLISNQEASIPDPIKEYKTL